MKKLLLLVVVIIAAVVLWKVTRPAAPVDVDDGGVIPDMAEGYAVYAKDQTVGEPISVKAVSMAEPGFALARAKGEASVFDGKVLGFSSLLAEGKVENVTMTMVGDMSVGDTVYIMLYDDTNENGVFDDGVDQPALDTAGNRVFSIILVKARVEVTPGM